MSLKDVFCYGNRELKEGKWQPLTPKKVGSDGNNGIGVTEYSHLLQVNEDTVINPANGDVLTKTKKGKEKGKDQYYSKATGIWVNAYFIAGEEDE
jgi:hypothetical protein